MQWASKYDQLICDETQDNNNAQWTLAKLLAWDHQNFMAIGDCFQAIYGFRGSSPDYLANFEQHWPGAKTVWLPRNYRSGKSIIAAANKIVQKANVPGLTPQDMIGERDLDGTVQVVCAEAQDDEANEVVTRIEHSVKSGESTFADHTVLFRTNAQSRALEESLLKQRIPYVVVGGVSFYERKEVRDLLAYLRLAAGRAKVEDVKRSINTPFRFLGTRFVERVMDQVDERTVDDADWAQVVEEVSHQERLQERQRHSAREWAGLVRGMQRDIEASQQDNASLEQQTAGRPAVLLEGIVRATQYITWLQKEEGDETVTDSHAANVREMIRVAERFETPTDLLDYIDETIRAARRQREDKQAGGERVLLMSVHRSKGLEWPHVYVVGLNEMILPHAKGDPEEERRLAYVAATRARDVLTMTFVRRIATRAGIKDVAPSRFVLDTGIPVVGFGVDAGPSGSEEMALVES
jgi:DNA helicase-2/ATP-dependent DNA helicase PcrA